jgi:hypothetical protein
MRLKRALALAAVPVAVVFAAGAGAGIAHASGNPAPGPSLSITGIGATSVTLSLPVAEQVQVYQQGIGSQVYLASLAKGVHVVSGLTAGTAYDVRATIGRGWSDSILFVTTAAPGAQGAPGTPGAPGAPGANAQALPYGIGEVLVDTGSVPVIPWAVYSTTLGSPSPGGDTTSGEFEFTCKNVANGCNVSLQAYATAPGYKVYPRIILTKQDNTTEDVQACEYGDGTDNGGGTAALTNQASAVTVGYGSTWDCGGNEASSPNGAPSINVPGAAGEGEHYYVQTTWSFLKA